jgi:uncharacterized membrane protein YjgN (DUF898 family)
MPFHALALVAGCFILCISILLITSNSITLDCYNSNTEFANKDATHKTNKQYTTYILVMAILCILVSMGVMYMAVSDKGQAVIAKATGP